MSHQCSWFMISDFSKTFQNDKISWKLGWKFETGKYRETAKLKIGQWDDWTDSAQVSVLMLKLCKI